MTWRDRCLVLIAIWNSIVFLTYGLDKRKAYPKEVADS